MTTMREALTKAAEEFETHARDYRRASARWRANGYDMDAAEMNRRAEVDEAMAKMCRDALAENDAAINKNEAWLKADLDRTLADAVGWFFSPCAECQWPNICGKANPCTLANLGVDPAQRSRFDMAADGTMRIGRLTADEWDGMVKPRQVLPTHRHERSGYKLQPPIFITTEFETYIVP